MTSEIINPRVNIPEPTAEKARNAVEAFRRMQPTLTGFAVALTGDKKCSVQMKEVSPRTDGKTIYMRPPIELGDMSPHIRTLCESRDAEMQLRCPACASRELVMTSLFHEIAHIAYDSFDKCNERDKEDALKRAMSHSTSAYTEEKLRKMRMRLDPSASYVELANRVNGFLALIHNALEDARVNALAFKARPGVKRMFSASEYRTFTKGVEQEDRSIMLWKDYAVNIQVICGLFCLGSGYDFDEWFCDEVVAALHDEIIEDLVSQVNDTTSVRETYYLSYPVFERLRELGYCLDEDETEEGDGGSENGEGSEGSDQESSASEPGSKGSSSGEDEAGESSGKKRGSKPNEEEIGEDSTGGRQGEGEGSLDPGDQSDQGSDEPGQDGDGSGSEDEPGDEAKERLDTGAHTEDGGITVDDESKHNPKKKGTPDEVIKVLKILGDHEEEEMSPEEKRKANSEQAALDRAIVQGIYFESPSRTVYGVKFHRKGDGTDTESVWTGGRYSYEYGQKGDFTTPQSVLGPALLKMRRAFTDNARAKEQHNLRSGRLNKKVLGGRAFHDDDRLFKKRTLPGKRDYFVLIGLDISGSTVGYNLALIKEAALAQAALCARMGIDFAVYAHTGTLDEEDRLWTNIYIVKEPREPWNDVTEERLTSLGSASANLDGHTLEQYRKIADAHRATDKIILYYTDGAMPAENFNDELEVLKREIATCKKKNITLLGVGVRTDSPRRHGLDTVQVDSGDDVGKVVEHLAKRLRDNSPR